MSSKNISIETTNKVLSTRGGLIFFDDLMGKMAFEERLKEILPKTGRKRFQKFKSLLLGFICGLDSLDDISKLRKDKLFSRLTAGACADSTLGDFLRAFSRRQIEQLNDLLLEISLQMRSMLFPDDNFVIYSSDSTPNVQCGKKMEGLGWNYKKQWGLDTLSIYDHRGFHYGFDVRPGGTYSSNGNVLMMDNIIRATSDHLMVFFHADSAFSNLDNYNNCLIHNCRFVMALKETSYGPLLRVNEIKWKKTDLQFFDSDRCEIGQCLYHVDGLARGKTYLRVVFIRAPKKDDQLSFLEDHYEYYAMVTDIGEHEKLPVMQKREYMGKRGKKRKEILDWKMVPATIENVICFYRNRGNTENFIKEEKYGLDLKHYPCQKMSANKVFGTIGAFAYNLMRFSSFLISKRGCYSKKIRFFLVDLPCQVVSHARKLTVRFNRQTKKEVCGQLLKIQNLFSSYYDSC
jgi:hypothetical protein